MEPITIKDWIQLAQFVWLIGISIAVAMRKPGEDAKQAISALERQVAAQDRVNATAIAEIKAKGELTEERVKHLPTHGDIRDLLKDVAEMKGQIQTVIDGQERWQRVTERIEDWLNNNRSNGT